MEDADVSADIVQDVVVAAMADKDDFFYLHREGFPLHSRAQPLPERTWTFEGGLWIWAEDDGQETDAFFHDAVVEEETFRNIGSNRKAPLADENIMLLALEGKKECRNSRTPRYLSRNGAYTQENSL